MIRIFKESSELEIWKRTRDGSFKLFESYDICTWSGELGPKIKEGDRQAPEGFYTITPGPDEPELELLPRVQHRLSQQVRPRLGPHRRQPHGARRLLVGRLLRHDRRRRSRKSTRSPARPSKAATRASSSRSIPFRMTPANIAQHASNANMPFWNNLKEGYDSFEMAAVRRPGTCATSATCSTCRQRRAARRDRGLPGLRGRRHDGRRAQRQAAGRCRRDRPRDGATSRTRKSAPRDRSQRSRSGGSAAEAEAKAKARGQAIGAFLSNVGSAIDPFGGNDESAEAPRRRRSSIRRWSRRCRRRASSAAERGASPMRNRRLVAGLALVAVARRLRDRLAFDRLPLALALAPRHAERTSRLRSTASR